jgi:branched-chain amino acid transport system substrate-binding protein
VTRSQSAVFGSRPARSLSSRAGRVSAVLAAIALLAAGCGSSSKSSSPSTSLPSGNVSSAGSKSTPGNTASAPGITPTAIKLGLVTSLTGDASSSESTAAIGAKAYFNAINEAGGINGRQIQLITADDTSSATGAVTATQLLISKGVFGIISPGLFFFEAYKAAQQAGIPVWGGALDGPEWGQQPNTNMFSWTGDIDPNHGTLGAEVPAAALFKTLGLEDVGALTYGNSPAAAESVSDLKKSIEAQGLKMGYENLSLAFGTTDITSAVLALKNAGVGVAVCSCVQSTTLAMVSGLKQAGANIKALSLAGADSSIFTEPTAAQASQGMYFSSSIPPLDTNNAASTTFENNIRAVDPGYVEGSYPQFGVVSAYLSAALAVKGFQVAGQNPTRQSYIASLSQVTNWNAEGLLSSPVSFNHFGTSEKTYCSWYVQVSGHSFVNVRGGNGANGTFCGTTPPAL